MTDEEKKAIDILQNCIADYVIGDFCCGKYCPNEDMCKNDDCYYEKAIDTVVTLIEKQEKVIDTMAKELKHISYYDFDMSQEEVKQYFYRKVENNE